MFGYVRPLRPELKCKDLDLYQATYCGLCRCLRRRCGLTAPLTLTYDCTFLALLLWEPERDFVPVRGRCVGDPLLKRAMCPDSPALDRAADVGVILAWWKLQDAVRDDGFWEGLPARAARPLLWGAYRRASGRLPDFDDTVRACLEELTRLEGEDCPSIDRTADTFARLLQAAAPGDGPRGRIFGLLLYHLGRWIYLADARDDLAEDMARGRYNPVSARFGPEGDDEALALTMDRSLELAGAALRLGDFGCRSALLENILYLGLPAVQRAVFDGSWGRVKKRRVTQPAFPRIGDAAKTEEMEN